MRVDDKHMSISREREKPDGRGCVGDMFEDPSYRKDGGPKVPVEDAFAAPKRRIFVNEFAGESKDKVRGREEILKNVLEDD